MWELTMDVKIFAEFLSIGCKNRKYAAAALQVYMELCEVKRYWNVKYKYEANLEILYFTAAKFKHDNESIFIPLPTSDKISHRKMQELQTFGKVLGCQSLYLVFVAGDTTCVYYQISEGLFEPVETLAKHLKTNKQEIRDNQIKRNRNMIEQAALCGTPITLSKRQETSVGNETTSQR